MQPTTTPYMNGSYTNGYASSGNATQQVFGQNAQLISEEVNKLGTISEQINRVFLHIQNSKSKCQNTLMNLNKDVSQLDYKISTYQSSNNPSLGQDNIRRQISQLQQDYLNTCKERVNIASQINVKNLRKVHIDDKLSTANQVFKWIIGTMYNQPDNKYFWPNFRQEALSNDKGLDFIQRLGKVSAMNVKQQHKVKTQQFLQNYPTTISNAPELQKYRAQTDKIHEIAKCYKRGYVIGGFIKQHQASINKHRESTMEKDQQFMRWKAKSQALKDRIQVNSNYLNKLNQIQARIAPKIQLYSQKHQSSQQLLQEFHNFGAKLSSQPQPIVHHQPEPQRWQPTIQNRQYLHQHPKGQCQCNSCSLF